MMPNRKRSAAAALEFAIVSTLLFTIFLGMIEVSRALMTLAAVSNAARAGARAGAVPTGSYTAVCDAVNASLSGAGINVAGNPTTVTINDVGVGDDNSFKAQATPGSSVAVQVRIPYSAVSWLPAGSTFFLSPNQQLVETVVMRKEG
jgi:Flp pilus assembly protein TadG